MKRITNRKLNEFINIQLFVKGNFTNKKYNIKEIRENYHDLNKLNFLKTFYTI